MDRYTTIVSTAVMLMAIGSAGVMKIASVLFDRAHAPRK
jgi:hypothetical protein